MGGKINLGNPDGWDPTNKSGWTLFYKGIMYPRDGESVDFVKVFDVMFSIVKEMENYRLDDLKITNTSQGFIVYTTDGMPEYTKKNNYDEKKVNSKGVFNAFLEVLGQVCEKNGLDPQDFELNWEKESGSRGMQNLQIDFLGYNNSTTLEQIVTDIEKKESNICQAYQEDEKGLLDAILYPIILACRPNSSMSVVKILSKEIKGTEYTGAVGSSCIGRILGNRTRSDNNRNTDASTSLIKENISAKLKTYSTLEEYWKTLNTFEHWNRNTPDGEERKKVILLKLAPGCDSLISSVLSSKDNTKANVGETENIGEILSKSKNLILYGPPGTGKTRKAKIEAYRLLTGNSDMSEKEALEGAKASINGFGEYAGRMKLVQFHPSYSYNDFMESIEVNGITSGYTDKIFKQFADEARKNPEQSYVLLIDEINRANVSDVLGELLYGLEYRGTDFTTEISGSNFSVPEKLYIIGTMNTADRSLQSLDYAVRRRFAFVKVVAELPETTQEKASDYYKVGDRYFYNKVFETVRKHVEQSVARGVEAEDILPGISYFLVNEKDGEPDEEHLKYKLKYELVPLLREYSKDGMFTNRSKLNMNKSLMELLRKSEQGYYEWLMESIDLGEGEEETNGYTD